MKKLISLVLIVSCVLSGFVTVNATTAESSESVQYPSPFDRLMPAIPVADAHFKRMADAGLTKEKIECIPGDANFDGKVNATDALFALVYG